MNWEKYKRDFGRVLAGLAISIGIAGRISAEPREVVVKIAAQIQRADYEGKRAELQRLYEELGPFVNEGEIGFRARYWRGFAKWRRAMNGYNDKVDLKEIKTDLEAAVEEFVESAKKGNGYVEAKIGEYSCVTMLAYGVDLKNPETRSALNARRGDLLKEVQAKEPKNPRLLWVAGASIWYTPEEYGGGQEKAMAMYETGLDEARKERTIAADELEPRWGEAELLMSLAWSNLNKKAPNLVAAEKNGRLALEMVPYWHYLMDILLVQIEDAKRKQKSSTGGSGASWFWRSDGAQMLRA